MPEQYGTINNKCQHYAKALKRRKKVRMSECAHVCRSLLARTVAEGVTAFSTEATLVSSKHIGRKRNF